MADTRDCEDALILDEVNKAFIEQDMAEGALEVIIKPAHSLDLAPSSLSSPSPPTSLPHSRSVPIFRWRTNTYRPYNFSASGYEFSKRNILEECASSNPIDVFEAVTNIKGLFEDIVAPESMLYAQKNGFSFTTDYDEITVFIRTT